MTGLGSSCGACKFLRRRCTSECVFAPYFNYDEAAAHFAVVHKVFGASNVSKLLTNLPMNDRREAAITISYEALARMHDPIYGCVSQIFALQQQVASLQEEIETLGIQMANLTVDVSSCGSSQATNQFNNELWVYSQQHNDMTNVQNFLSQQDSLLSHGGDTEGNHDLYTQMNIQFPCLGLEDQTSSVPYPDLSLLERLLEGIDQGIYASCPWIVNGSNTN
ncbi:hypothetical protein ACSBR1_027104 [Camellia fascicularis]